MPAATEEELGWWDVALGAGRWAGGRVETVQDGILDVASTAAKTPGIIAEHAATTAQEVIPEVTDDLRETSQNIGKTTSAVMVGSAVVGVLGVLGVLTVAAVGGAIYLSRE